MQADRIVVTGLGVTSSLGIGVESFWRALLAGTSGIVDLEGFDWEGSTCRRGGPVRGFTPSEFLGAEAPRFRRTSQMAIAASLLALEDAGIPLESLRGTRVGVILGTTMGEGVEPISESVFHTGRVDAREFQRFPDNLIPANVADFLGIHAYCLTIPTACAAGNYAIACASELLAAQRIDVAIAGGCDSFSRAAFTGFNRLMSLTPDVCRPFDLHRKGILIAEGAGILVLERQERALPAHRRVYAEMLGYGLSCDANHMTIPDGEGMRQVMSKALRHACVEPDQVDLVCAHGTGTPMSDKLECQGLARVLGDSLHRTPVVSIKSMLGHTMGAASAIEAIACVKAIHDSKIPPTINFETPDPDCPVDCVPNRMREADVKIVLNNSFAFGGNNAAVVFGKLGRS